MLPDFRWLALASEGRNAGFDRLRKLVNVGRGVQRVDG